MRNKHTNELRIIQMTEYRRRKQVPFKKQGKTESFD